MTTTSTMSEDLRLPEPSPAARLRQQANELIRLADELDGIALAGAPERAADPVADADHKPVVDTPSPGGLIALKSAAHIWGRSDRSMKKLASDHRALHRVGGRLMVDDERLRAGVFGHVFPLLDR